MAERTNRDNTIFVGKKPTMSYVLATVMQFGNNHPEVCLKARGRAISTAVDVAEIVRNKFLKDVEIKTIKTNTDEVTSKDGKEKMGVSSIEIMLGKK